MLLSTVKLAAVRVIAAQKRITLMIQVLIFAPLTGD